MYSNVDWDKLNKKVAFSTDKESYLNEIDMRLKSLVEVGRLVGKDGELITYRKTDRIKELLKEINDRVNNLGSLEGSEERALIEEAYSTNTIEGADTTVAETVKLRKGKRPTNKSQQMVYNTLNTIDSLEINKFNFTQKEIMNVWDSLTYKVLDNEEIRGDLYRCGEVVIHNSLNKTVFEAPSYIKVPMMMDLLEEYIKENSDEDDIIKSIIIHYYLVYIHPFCDGNGRISRLLLSTYLIKKGYDIFNNVSITSEVLEDRSRYYKSLRDSENEYNDITPFIEFYLESINKVLDRYSRGFDVGLRSRLNSNQTRFIVGAKKHKIRTVSVSEYSKKWNISEDEARGDLTELEDAELLTKVSEGRYEITESL